MQGSVQDKAKAASAEAAGAVRTGVSGSAAPPTPAAQVQAGLSASRYNLSRLTESVRTVQAASAPEGLRGRLVGIEQQYAQLDAAMKGMPANATPQQWIVLQQQMYNMSENIGTLSKMVSQASSGMKSLLQTQV